MARRLSVLVLAFLALTLVAGCTRTSVDTDPSAPSNEMATVKGEKAKKMETGVYGTLVVETIDGRPALLVLEEMRTQEKLEGGSKPAKRTHQILEAVVSPGARCIAAKWMTHKDPPSLSMRDDAAKLLEEQISSSMCFMAAEGVTYHMHHAEERGAHFFWIETDGNIVGGAKPGN